MSIETLEKILEVKTGPLADIFPLFDTFTLQHAHEIMRDRQIDRSLRNQWFWTTDFPMYRVENGEAVIYFAPREHNLIFRDIQNATSQLLENQNYIPTKEGIDEVLAAEKRGAVLKVKLSDLRLEIEKIGSILWGNPFDLRLKDSERGYFEIDPENPNLLNPAERAFAERVYGQENEFSKNMGMLREHTENNIIKTTRVYILNPDYVKKQLKDKGDSAIARASCLGGLSDWAGSWFSAAYNLFGLSRFDSTGLRGVLKERKRYSQERILEHLRTNPIEDWQFASALLNEVKKFYQRKKA